MDKNSVSKVKQGSIFEEKVKNVLEILGYHVKVNELIDGNQIDLIAQKSDGLVDICLLVECKDESKPIGIDRIKKLDSVIRVTLSKYPGSRGLFVSMKGFTKEAKATAKQLAIQCFSFEELERSLIDCKSYLRWLIEDFGKEFKGIYVNLHGEYRKKEQTIYYRPIDTFLDRWLIDEIQNHISILGEYGTGKTTFCRYYAAKLAERYLNDPSSNRIPILINLREFAREMNIESLITNHLVNKAGIRNASFPIFRWMLEKGLLVVIFDGFDEMAQRTDFDVTWSNFKAIADLVKLQSKIILTCRIEYFRTHTREIEILHHIESLSNFDIIHIQKLDDNQIKEYLQKRIGRSDDPKTDWHYYWKQITTIFDLHDLAIRPVLLNFIIGHLPDLIGKEEIRASDLYEVAIEKELKRALTRGTTLIRREDRIKLIQLLSAWMYENNQFFLHFEKIPEILNIKEYFDLKLQIDIDHHLHDFLTCSFLSKDPDGNYSFSHKSFIDFFVAKKLVEEVIQVNQKNWSKYTLSREVTRFIGEIASKDIETINKICEWAFEGKSHLRYNAATAITCMNSNMVVSYVKKRKDEVVLHSMLIWALGEISYESEEDKKEIINLLDYIVKTQINHSWSWWIAAFAIEKLDGTKKPVKMLIDNLKDNKQYFFDVEKCFNKIEDPRSVVSILIHAESLSDTICNKLSKIMKKFVKNRDYSSWYKAHNLCWLVGQFKIIKLTNELIEFIRDQKISYSDRNMATEALGKIGIAIGESGFKAVLERLRVANEPYYRTRYHAAQALGKIGKKEAISELEIALSEEYEPIVRKEIKRSIDNLQNMDGI